MRCYYELRPSSLRLIFLCCTFHGVWKMHNNLCAPVQASSAAVAISSFNKPAVVILPSIWVFVFFFFYFSCFRFYFYFFPRNHLVILEISSSLLIFLTSAFIHLNILSKPILHSSSGTPISNVFVGLFLLAVAHDDSFWYVLWLLFIRSELLPLSLWGSSEAWIENLFLQGVLTLAFLNYLGVL